MKQTKLTQINIKTTDVLVIRSGFAPPHINCPNCGAEVEILTADQAAARGIGAAAADVTAYTDINDRIVFQEER